ncbi:hypothetical protein STEG23_011170, partial [Scotinomys teguina]
FTLVVRGEDASYPSSLSGCSSVFTVSPSRDQASLSVFSGLQPVHWRPSQQLWEDPASTGLSPR